MSIPVFNYANLCKAEPWVVPCALGALAGRVVRNSTAAKGAAFILAVNIIASVGNYAFQPARRALVTSCPREGKVELAARFAATWAFRTVVVVAAVEIMAAVGLPVALATAAKVFGVVFVLYILYYLERTKLVLGEEQAYSMAGNLLDEMFFGPSGADFDGQA